ncbi:ribonuclease J [Hyphobacterium sp.]|uniref:ribonuclease J n=1 Tax=Hyphobacterium sp. TaxID=2004662 RepID=UPI003BAB8CA8
MVEESGLYFLPLGGSGEIGMNLNLYGYGPEEKRKWIMVDCGVTFGDLSTPGIDVILPDPDYIEERAHDLLAIILTHAHEDHMGAVAHLWERFRCPIYATPFTAWLMVDRLREKGLENEAIVNVLPIDGQLSLGPFDISLVTLTHSIPEPNGLAIRTPEGLILHTGDWKIDPEPLIGQSTDVNALTSLADEGVLAMICDSTNVFTEGESGSEAGVRENLIKLVGELTGRVAIASFASNVARMESAIVAAEANGRRVCLVGRSMHRMAGAAKSVGLLAGTKPFIDEDDAAHFPPDKILYLCTGSQGEPRAALSRIARGDHRVINLTSGDTVIFSSRVIPGNEAGIFELQNMLTERGVDIITERDRHIHVSGHPCRDELKQMYAWVRPQISIPVHGERRHLIEHAEFARSLQVPQALAPRNGDLIRISKDGASVVDEVKSGRLYVDGRVVAEAESAAMRERRSMAYAGHVTVAMVIDGQGSLISGPDVRALGLPENEKLTESDWLDSIAEAAEESFDRLKRRARCDEAEVEESARRAVRRLLNQMWGKKPQVDVMVLTA